MLLWNSIKGRLINIVDKGPRSLFSEREVPSPFKFFQFSVAATLVFIVLRRIHVSGPYFSLITFYPTPGTLYNDTTHSTQVCPVVVVETRPELLYSVTEDSHPGSVFSL